MHIDLDSKLNISWAVVAVTSVSMTRTIKPETVILITATASSHKVVFIGGTSVLSTLLPLNNAMRIKENDLLSFLFYEPSS